MYKKSLNCGLKAIDNLFGVGYDTQTLRYHDISIHQLCNTIHVSQYRNKS